MNVMMANAVKNPFLVARLVFFAMSAYLTVSQLVFAAWNIHATTTIGLKAPPGIVFLLSSACLNLLCLIMASGVVEIAVPALKVPNIVFECVWSATAALLQTGMAILTSVSSPDLFCGLKEQSSCAAFSLLIPVTWSNGIILLSYFFTLIITTVAHSNAHSNIWANTAYDIDWFGYLSARGMGSSAKGYDVYCSEWTEDMSLRCKSVAMEDLENAPWAHYDEYCSEWAQYTSRCKSVAMEGLKKAPWARTAKVRRGIDPPFAKDKKPGAKNMPMPAPTVPPRLHERVSNDDFRLVEVTNQIIGGPRFPSTVYNHDLPIRIPKRSEWVRANSGISTDESRWL